jgi:hypothetical protein
VADRVAQRVIDKYREGPEYHHAIGDVRHPTTGLPVPSVDAGAPDPLPVSGYVSAPTTAHDVLGQLGLQAYSRPDVCRTVEEHLAELEQAKDEKPAAIGPSVPAWLVAAAGAFAAGLLVARLIGW